MVTIVVVMIVDGGSIVKFCIVGTKKYFANELLASKQILMGFLPKKKKNLLKGAFFTPIK